MLTLVSALERNVKLYGNEYAVVDKERNFTWEGHVKRVAKLSGALQTLGLCAGDKFGIIGENSFRYTELLHSGYWGGAIPVAINHRLAPPEILHILEDSDCKLLALGKEFLPLIESKELTDWKKNCVYIGPLDETIPQIQYEKIIEDSKGHRARECDEDELALLLYTGGTTGKSKGVQLTHKNIISNGMQIAIEMKAHEQDIYLHAAPMFHAADLLCTAFTLTGAAHAYLPVFSPRAALESIEGYKVTKTMMAPTMIIMCLTDSEFNKYDTSSLKMMLYGSSPMAAEWVEKSIQGFNNTEIVQGYGLTECAPILTFLDWKTHKNAVETGDIEVLRAAGRAIVGLDLKITGHNGEELTLGEVGEVTVRGPQVSIGYLNRPEENKQSFKEGWFYTGDVGRMDENGIIFLLDRKKDMIVSGGENIYTSEVEAVLYQHPDIQECAVVGIPDDKFGEALFAAIVVASGKTLNQTDVIKHCRDKIGGFKIPRQIDFVKEMPKSAMGKILKNELRRIYGSK